MLLLTFNRVDCCKHFFWENDYRCDLGSRYKPQWYEEGNVTRVVVSSFVCLLHSSKLQYFICFPFIVFGYMNEHLSRDVFVETCGSSVCNF